MNLKPLILAAASLLAAQAHATEYNQVQADKSTIQFSYQQMGVKMDGKFKKFTSQLAFDPAKPTAARAQFDVELASVAGISAEQGWQLRAANKTYR